MTLSRRVRHEIRYHDGLLVNEGDSDATIEYIQGEGDCFESLRPAIYLESGESVTVEPLICGDSSNFWVPAEAVTTHVDAGQVLSEFYVINGDEFVDYITVTNLLPGYDEERGGTLEYVEVVVTASSGAEMEAVEISPFRLSAAHTHGAERILPMLRLGSRPLEITIEGVAFYENGGCQTLRKTVFENPAVKIIPSMLPSLDPNHPGDSQSADCRSRDTGT